MKFVQVNYNELNSRQQENFNFAKLAAILADFGYSALRLSDHWNGTDFIAVPIRGEHLMIQLKGRLTFDKKYENKNLWIAFPNSNGWRLYEHDVLLNRLRNRIQESRSWSEYGGYSWPGPPDWAYELLEEYRLGATPESLVGVAS